MFEECPSQVWSTSNAAGGFACLGSDGAQVLADELGHVGPRQMAPEIFDRVQFRRVSWQILHRQPLRLLCDPCLHFSTAMRRQPVPQQDRLPSSHVSLERSQVRQHLRLFDGSWSKPQTQPYAPRRRRGDQAGDRRQSLPVERRHQDRRLSARRPSPTHAGTFRKPALIQENQQRPVFTGLFLILGQRYRTQRLMASSLRSRAFRSGRWQVQPNCRRTFQT